MEFVTALTNSLRENNVISLVAPIGSIKEIVGACFANKYPVFAPSYAFGGSENVRMYGYEDMKHIIHFVLTTGSTVDVIEPNTILARFDPSTDNNYYAYTLATMAPLYHIKVVFIGPGAVFGTPYLKLYKSLKPLDAASAIKVQVVNIPNNNGLTVSSFVTQITPIIKNTKARPKILILTPDEEFTSNLVFKLKNATNTMVTTYVNDTENSLTSYALITHKINDNVMQLRKFDKIIVHAIVEERSVELGLPNIISNDFRPFNDFRILNNFTTNIILITNDEITLNDIASKPVANFTNEGIYDVAVLFSRYNAAYIIHNNKIIPKLLPKEITSSNEFNIARGILSKMGVLDNSYTPTDLAADILSYSKNIYVGLFYYYWTRSKHDQFPGIVIASFLEQLPVLRTDTDQKYDTSLHEYLLHWNELVSKVKSEVLNPKSEVVKQWCRNKFGYRAQNFIKVIKTIISKCKTQNIKIFGQFTLEGALSRAIPIFDMVYKSFKATLTKDNYLLNGEHYSYNYYPTMNKYSNMAILEVENGDPSIIAIAIPLSDTPSESFISISEGISLPNLDLTYFDAYRRIKSQVITTHTIPIKQHAQLKR